MPHQRGMLVDHERALSRERDHPEGRGEEETGEARRRDSKRNRARSPVFGRSRDWEDRAAMVQKGSLGKGRS